MDRNALPFSALKNPSDCGITSCRRLRIALRLRPRRDFAKQTQNYPFKTLGRRAQRKTFPAPLPAWR